MAILAGGAGRRFKAETDSAPKAMAEIGGRPILWHIMRLFAHFGFADFVIALGYRGDEIRAGLRHLNGEAAGPTWAVELVETGTDTQTGGRIQRLRPQLGGGTFLLTWCDGLADIDLDGLLAFHRDHGKLATVTAVHPPPRFGVLDLEGDRVAAFREKPIDVHRWINGAFFALEPGIFDYIDGDDDVWERGPLERLAGEGQLMAYRHTSFWQCMDTIAEQRWLNELWERGAAPWKLWA